MDGSHFDHIDQTATTTGHSGRRGALRAVGALGVSLLAALGLANDAGARGFRTKRVISDPSAPLGEAAGTVENTSANCDGGKILSCGYLVNGTAAQLVNTMVTFAAPTDDRKACVAELYRTAEAGSTAGATTRAIALCRV